MRGLGIGLHPEEAAPVEGSADIVQVVSQCGGAFHSQRPGVPMSGGRKGCGQEHGARSVHTGLWGPPCPVPV